MADENNVAPEAEPQAETQAAAPETGKTPVKEVATVETQVAAPETGKTPVKEAATAETQAAAPETGKTPVEEVATAKSASEVMAPETESRDSDDREERRGRRGRSVPAGVAHIRATFNNTIVTISDARGNVISWSTAGKAGFKGSRKSTAFAGTMVAQDAGRAAAAKGMHEVEIRVQGAGAGRESAVRGIQSAGMHISVIKDVTPIAHNGCRPRKRRRV